MGVEERRDPDSTGFFEEPTDIALMLRVRQTGDPQAFALLAARYRTPLRRFFAALLPDAGQADDFAQETLLRLWTSRTRYEPTGSFSAYLFQIGRHYWLNQRVRYRAQAAQEVSTNSAAFELEIPLPARAQPETVVLERIEQARLSRAIDALPPPYRVVFAMSHFDALKYAEIACRLGIPVGTVKSRMAKAVRCLRESLSHEE